MLCVTRIRENGKSIQNANNFMRKHIIRQLQCGYNSGTLEAMGFNIWTDVFPLNSVANCISFSLFCAHTFIFSCA